MSNIRKRKTTCEVERPNIYDPSKDIFAPQKRTYDVSEDRRRVDEHIHSPTKRLRPLPDPTDDSSPSTLEDIWTTTYDLADWFPDPNTAEEKLAARRYPASVSTLRPLSFIPCSP